MNLVFKDRRAAGEQLSAKLQSYNGKAETIVAGLARGGVVVAHAVAQALNLPLDVIVIRKVGAPFNEELAIGAVDEEGHAILNEKIIQQLGISPLYVKEEVENQKLAQKRAALYRSGRKRSELKGKTVIVVDDGIATGASMRAAIYALRQKGVKKIVMAVPVAAPDSLKIISNQVDEAVCLGAPEFFSAVGQFYEYFDQTSDSEVATLLR